MKTIFILRHAKSDWGAPAVKDFDRTLNERGRQAVPRMGAYFRSMNYQCSIVLCSTAQRTRQTLELVKPYLGDDVAVEFDDKIYLAEPKYLMTRLRGLSDELSSAMLIGHNPGLEQLAHSLAGKARSEETQLLHRRMQDKFSTCALAVIRCPAKSWGALKPGQGELLDFMRPKEL